MSVPAWAWAAFIASVLVVVAVMSVLDARRGPNADRGRESPARERAGWGRPRGPGKERARGPGRDHTREPGQSCARRPARAGQGRPVTVAGQASSHGTRGGPGT
jgi:hypothetical protein